MNDFDNEILRAYVRGVLSRNRCAPDAEQLQEICAEHGVSYAENTFCNGFCPDCGQILSCEAYEEINDEWDGFYI